MARYSVIALLGLALSSIILSDSDALNVLKLQLEVADFSRPKESNGTRYQVKRRINHCDLDGNCLSGGPGIVTQCDVQLLFSWYKYLRTPEGSVRKQIREKVVQAMSHTMHIEYSTTLIGNLLFGIEKGPEVLKTNRPEDLPFVDDPDRLDSLVKIFETYCGSLECGGNALQSIANICNAGIKEEQMARAAAQACASNLSNPCSALQRGWGKPVTDFFYELMF